MIATGVIFYDLKGPYKSPRAHTLFRACLWKNILLWRIANISTTILNKTYSYGKEYFPLHFQKFYILYLKSTCKSVNFAML